MLKEVKISVTIELSQPSLLYVNMNTGSSIITKRLTFHTQAYNKICECQGGFREGYSTLDNGFILKSIINIYLSMKGK